jgi:hypothetical protein
MAKKINSSIVNDGVNMFTKMTVGHHIVREPMGNNG